MIHGGVPFKDLQVGDTFEFPAHAKPGQYRSGVSVKMSSRTYAPRHNVAAHGHPWNTYVHDVRSEAPVHRTGKLSANELAEVLHAIDATKKQDRARMHAAAGGGGSNMTPDLTYYARGLTQGWPSKNLLGGGGSRAGSRRAPHRRGGGGADMTPEVPYYLVENARWGRPGGGGGANMTPEMPYYLAENARWGRPGGGGARLTYQEKKAAPDSDFALIRSNGERMFYIGDATHAANGMSRLSKSWNMGHLTQAEYKRAHDRIRAAERHFGIVHHGGHYGAKGTTRHAEAAAGGAARTRRR